MIIKRMEIGYGGVLSANFEIVKNGHEIVFRYGDKVPDKVITRVPDQTEWKRFAEAITPLLKTWQREYRNQETDVQWSVNIETTDGVFSFCGSNDFPEDFNSFLLHCRNIIGENESWFPSEQENFTVNFFNRRIKRLLKERGKTVNQLAKYLNCEPDKVKLKLESVETFLYQDLIKICSFLNELPSDFFYEVSPHPSAEILRELRSRSVMNTRATQLQIVKFYLDNVIYN